ncbi:hypothetical protein SXCC_02884 [Gluconacetobacter sp. SXCC-1]|nr:hypothetical protein SXCC_02884 [Gluconacetobacter sp. SXCC-1]
MCFSCSSRPLKTYDTSLCEVREKCLNSVEISNFCVPMQLKRNIHKIIARKTVFV